MRFYRDNILPWLTHLTMQQPRFVPYRRRVISRAAGRVLEIGIGSGLNLPFYGGSAAHVIGIDPSPRLLDMARRAAQRGTTAVELIEATADAIPVEDASIDTVVTTWAMCSVPKLDDALVEVRRVLRPDGSLLFVEHGRAPDPDVRRWQDHLTPAWKHLSGGCHLNRAIEDIVRSAGFRFEHLEKAYMPGPKLMTFMYEGHARPR